ncbi:uncharacterized protein H6S33_012189 [Morchella sextelata]|uniref:uncharacterized protein n=1 Tax=Morchella sextelata TaxID=1174677 RepID=UPI001D05A638|nr:uncharacterized protein H6S33_012189 [Morchella sextelata]KAH0610662.1 hypothetical protein H6S33_012189 [Morchella sextelata]
MGDKSLACQQGFRAGYLAAFHASLQILPEPMQAALRAAAAPTHAVQMQTVAESADVSTDLEVGIINLPKEEGEEGEEEKEKEEEEKEEKEERKEEEKEEEDEEEEEEEEEGSDTDTPTPAPKRRRLSRPPTTAVAAPLAPVAPAVDAASLILAIVSNLHSTEDGSHTNP